MNDFKEKLVKALVPHDPKLIVYAKGCKHPGYNTLSVVESFHRFCKEILPLSPLVDPRGKRITIIENNFPKFLNLEPKKQGDPARPIILVRAIKAGQFDACKYKWEADRIRDLFWVPEVLTRPDAIYKNKHLVIDADEVYAKVYDKQGSTVKLAFVKDISPKLCVVVTSYLTNPIRAMACFEGEPIWPPRKEKLPLGSLSSPNKPLGVGVAGDFTQQ